MRTRLGKAGQLTSAMVLGWLVLGAAAVRAQDAAEPSAPLDEPAQVQGRRLEQIREGGRAVLVLYGLDVTQGSARITGDIGRYDRQQGTLAIDGNVVYVDGDLRLESERGTYSTRTRGATASGNVRLSDGEFRARAPRGTYDRSLGVARMGGGVRIQDDVEGRSVVADSVVYWADDDRVEAFGSVRIDQPEDDLVIRGNLADFDREGDRLHVTGDASLVLEEGAQPVLLAANDLFFDRRTDEVEALGRVRVQQGDTEAYGHRALVHRRANEARITGAPVAISGSGRVRGDTLRIHFRGGEADRLLVIGNARSIYRDASVAGEELRLSGDELLVRIRESEAEEVIATGNARTRYTPGDDERRSGARGNTSEGQRIRLLLDGGEPLQVFVTGQAQGRYTYVEQGAASPPDEVEGAAPATPVPIRADSLAAAPSPPPAAPSPPAPPAAASSDRLAAADSLEAAATPDSIMTESLAYTRALADSLGLGTGFDAPLRFEEPDSVLATIVYSADQVVFLAQRDEIRLEQNSKILYGDTQLTADNVRFDADERTLLATGSPVLSEREQEVRGDLMTYDLTSRRGDVVRGETSFERGLYSGANLHKDGEGVFHVEGAGYTTCDLSTPHYHFAGRQMKIYLNDKVVTRPLGLYVGRVPILALPFYLFPIKKGRQSGLLIPRFEFGVSDTRGRFVRNAGYYWAINDYTDLEAWADISEESPFFIANTRFVYKKRYVLDGNARVTASFAEGNRRWDIEGAHTQKLTPDLTLRANIDFVSDRNFRQDEQGLFVENRLDTDLRSNLTLSKSWPSHSLRIALNRNQRLQDVDGSELEGEGLVTGSFPSLSYSFSGNTLGQRADAKGRGARLPWLATTNYRFGLGYNNSYNSTRVGSRYLQSADGNASINDSRTLGYLRFGPSWSINSNYVERTEVSEAAGLVPDVRHVLSGSWTTSASLSTDLYGFFAPTVGIFHGFKHVMTPRASLSYRRPFDSRPTQAVVSSSSFNLSLQNRFQTRLKEGDDDYRILRDFFSLNLSTSYDLDNRSDQRFSDIRGSGSLRPGLGDLFDLNYNFIYDPYLRRNENYNLSTRFRFDRQPKRSSDEPGGAAADDGGQDQGASAPAAAVPTVAETGRVDRQLLFPHAYRLGGSLTFAGSAGSDKSLEVNLGTGFSLTPKWRLEYDIRYDVIDREITSQQYVLARNLHCWETQFRRSFSGRRWEYYFQIRLRDLPDIFYERGSRSSRTPRLY